MEYSHLLSDDIKKMPLKEQEVEVRNIIEVCPEYVKNQIKFDELK